METRNNNTMQARLRPLSAYYDETWLEYRLLWLDPTNYAVHFGYWTIAYLPGFAALLISRRN